MPFQPIPNSGPLPLAGQETSPLFEFSIPGEFDRFFIRVIALFRDNEPLGGEAVPTFQLRAWSGVITSVEAGSGDVSVPGGGGNPVATVRCAREPRDIYLITLTDVVENSGPWKLRIRNNDPETLRILAFGSHKERDTKQPWMRLGDPNFTFVDSHLEFTQKMVLPIEVRNWGTAPLRFQDATGPIGDRDSHLVLKTRPDTVEPHGLDVITFEAVAVDGRSKVTHQFRCNDLTESHTMISLEINPPIPVPAPPPPEFFCREGCGCDDFVGSVTALTCERAICGHSRIRHLPI